MIGLIRKCLVVLGPGNLLPAFWVLAISILASLFEIFGIALVMAVLTIFVTDPTSSGVTGIPAIVPIHFLHAVPFGMLLAGIFGAYVLKGGCVLLARWVAAAYVNHSDARIASRMLELYLRAPYRIIAHIHTSQLVQKIEYLTSTALGGTVMAGLTVVSQGILLAGAGVLLLLIDPVATLWASLFLAVGGPVYLRVSNPRAGALGEEVTRLSRDYLKALQESLSALKELRITDTIGYFHDAFRRPRDAYAIVKARKAFILAAAPVYLELLAIATVLILFVSLTNSHGERGTIIVLGAFAAAISRMIGYVNSIITGINQMKFARASMDELYEDWVRLSAMQAMPDASVEIRPLPYAKALGIENIMYSHTGNEQLHLDGIDIKVPFGEMVAVIGSSGAGKSTLVDIITGLLPPDCGRVLVDGMDIAADPVAWRANIGYVTQSFCLLDDTIRRNIAFGISDNDIDAKRVEDALRGAQIDDFVASLPEGLDTMVGDRGVKLSGGQRQRIAIARALYRRPRLLILDEATSALDPQTEQNIIDVVESLKPGMGVIIVTHRPAAARRCDRVYQIENGKLIRSGTFAEVESANHADGGAFFAARS